MAKRISASLQTASSADWLAERTGMINLYEIRTAGRHG
jgi:hypothetical protein